MKDATDITIILDRSGSMDVIREDTVGGLNRFIKDQQAIPGACNLTLVQFDGQDPYETLRHVVPINMMKPIQMQEYQPRGDTPLCDAVGKGIANTGERLSQLPDEHRPDKVIFVVITDGLENASKEFSQSSVQQMIKRQREEYNWQFVFLGANIDSAAVARGMDIPTNQAMNYAQNKVGTSNMYRGVSENVGALRRGTKKDLSFTDEQREEAMKE